MKFKNILCVTLAGLLAVSASACGKKDKDAMQEAKAINVTVFEAQQTGISNKVTYSGEIKEGEYVSISSKVSAKVQSVKVDQGQYVNAGDVLVVLDSTDLQLTYNQALAGYNSAKAGYDMTVNATTQQSETAARQKLSAAQIEHDDSLAAYNREKSLYENNTSLVSSRNALNDAKLNLERTQQLFDMGAATQVQLDTAKTGVENAQASLSSLESTSQTKLDSAKNRYNNAVTNLNSAKENLNLTFNVLTKESKSTAAAAVESAKAALEIARNSLNNTAITAPISGFVASKNVNVGQTAAPGAELMSVKNANSVDGEINVTESLISYVNVGTPAQVTVKSAGIESIEGAVTLVNQTKDAKTGLYTVRVTIPNEDNRLKVGMFADITLTTNSVDNVIAVPSDSILQENSEMYVYVANGDTAEKRAVTAGISDDKYTEIISGINAGDKIIVKGKEYLSEKNNQINIVES